MPRSVSVPSMPTIAGPAVPPSCATVVVPSPFSVIVYSVSGLEKTAMSLVPGRVSMRRTIRMLPGSIRPAKTSAWIWRMDWIVRTVPLS